VAPNGREFVPQGSQLVALELAAVVPAVLVPAWQLPSRCQRQVSGLGRTVLADGGAMVQVPSGCHLNLERVLDPQKEVADGKQGHGCLGCAGGQHLNLSTQIRSRCLGCWKQVGQQGGGSHVLGWTKMAEVALAKVVHGLGHGTASCTQPASLPASQRWSCPNTSHGC